jgi:putative holliday junction resolvase
MRWMGIDLGERRIGIALSDPDGWMATPLQTVPVTSRDSTMQTVIDLVVNKEVQAIVAGLPINMDGTEGLAARRARRFAQRLRQRLGIDVFLWDERMSTQDAYDALAHLAPAKRRARVDAVAAALILQNYLDTTFGGQSREPGQ